MISRIATIPCVLNDTLVEFVFRNMAKLISDGNSPIVFFEFRFLVCFSVLVYLVRAVSYSIYKLREIMLVLKIYEKAD